MLASITLILQMRKLRFRESTSQVLNGKLSYSSTLCKDAPKYKNVLSPEQRPTGGDRQVLLEGRVEISSPSAWSPRQAGQGLTHGSCFGGQMPGTRALGCFA